MADPLKYENLFPGFKNALETEKIVRAKVLNKTYPASIRFPPNYERNLTDFLNEDLDKLATDISLFIL